MKHIALLINSWKTVFRRDDIELLLDIKSVSGISNFFTRAQKQEILYRKQNGLWTLKQYWKEELACKIRKKSYVSLETVLYQAWIIFQFSPHTIFCISDDTRRHTIDGIHYQYHKIKDEILLNPLGIMVTQTTMRASPERAFCDLLYLYPKSSVENFEWLNRKKLEQIIQIYPQSTALALQKLFNDAESSTA
jgi:hypothetical protein